MQTMNSANSRNMTKSSTVSAEAGGKPMGATGKTSENKNKSGDTHKSSPGGFGGTGAVLGNMSEKDRNQRSSDTAKKAPGGFQGGMINGMC